MRGRPTRVGGLRLLVLAGFAVLAGAGCARLFSHYDIAPNGLSRRDDRLRRLLASGHADSAFARVAADADAAPDDELLRALYAGLLAHYAGAYDSSNAALQRAADLAEDRYTKSLSRAALSLVSGDQTLPYEPGWTERLLIHYYGALNRLRQDDLEGAAVEARRLAFLLERESERGRDGRSAPMLALLRYFTGVVFEAAGERGDADVAYRNALTLAARGDDLPVEAPLPDSLGEVVVVVEQAFVAHRVEQAVVVPLHPVEVAWLTGADGDRRAATIAAVGARVVARVLAETTARPWYHGRPPTLYVELPPDEYFERACARGAAGPVEAPARGDTAGAPLRCPGAGENPYLLRIAWPAYRLEDEPEAGLRVLAADSVAEPLRFAANLSDAVARDFDDERTLRIARTVARAVSKLALTKGVEHNVGGDEEWVGRLLGALANVGTALLEQADTRSWQLLPARIGIARLRLPPGEHRIALERAGGGGPSRLEVGSADVRAGRLTVLQLRVWR